MSVAIEYFYSNKEVKIFNGDSLKLIQTIPDETVDLVVTSPPYFMGKEYDRSKKVEDFIESHQVLFPEIIRVTKNGGSICWQVGYHSEKDNLIPLDYLIYEILKKFENLFLRNRIVWSFGHGLHAKYRFSGRHETVLWFSKGKNYHFDLDAVRIPQKYPGKRHYKGEKKGEFSSNPLGKNPSDVWEIPNVNSNHIEKTDHPCQFPVALAQRLIKALTPEGGIVFDPYMGSGSSCIAALLEKRKFIGADTDLNYCTIAKERILDFLDGKLIYRPLEQPIFEPNQNMAVAQKPINFK